MEAPLLAIPYLSLRPQHWQGFQEFSAPLRASICEAIAPTSKAPSSEAPGSEAIAPSGQQA